MPHPRQQFGVVTGSSSGRTGICGTRAVEVEAAAGGEAAAFGFVGGRNVKVGVLGATGESGVKRVEVAGVEGRSGNFGG